MNILSVRPDYLGPDWVATSFSLESDDGGAPVGRSDVAVLVHRRNAPELARSSRVAALYLPGFLDSFFHTEQADAFQAVGVPLVGLDMRRCGRSVRSENSRDDLRDIYVREEEIGKAIAYLRSWGVQRIVLIGHSTGGLQAALWAADHPGTVDAVVLNSPWLDHNGPAIERGFLTRVVDRLGARFPAFAISRLSSRYPRSLHVNFGGDFFFDPRHKPLYRVKVHAGFFRTVRRAQARIASGDVHFTTPLLVAHSDSSGHSKWPSAKELESSDVILGVEDMVRLAPLLNPDVKLVEIPNGRHDLALSQREARNLYTREVVSWVKATLNLR